MDFRHYPCSLRKFRAPYPQRTRYYPINLIASAASGRRVIERCPMRFMALSAGVETPALGFSGVVHSIFRQACNVSLECDSLLTLLSSEKGNAPQGIRVRTPLNFTFRNQLCVGQAVACRGGILRITGSDLSIDLRPASPWHVDLKGLRVALHQHNTAQAWATAWLELGRHRRGDGISAMLAPIQEPKQNPVTQYAIQALLGKTVQAVPALIEATRTFRIDDAITALRSLVGLGPGLTPSGDDFIVGYLAGLWSTAGGDLSRLRFISSVGAWLSRSAAGTNAISRSFLTSAVSGNICEPLATLAQRIGQANSMDSVREAAGAALRVGNTSGADGVLGLLLGCIPWAAPSST